MCSQRLCTAVDRTHGLFPNSSMIILAIILVPTLSKSAADSHPATKLDADRAQGTRGRRGLSQPGSPEADVRRKTKGSG